VTFGDSDLVARVTAILPLDSFLVVTDSRTDPHVMVFDLGSGRVISEFGRHGGGPGEFQYPASLVGDPVGGRAFWAYDFNLRRFTRIGISHRGRPSTIHTVPLGVGVSLLQASLRADTFVANGLFTDYSLLLADATGRPIARVDLSPPFGPPDVTLPIARRLLNPSSLASSPDGARIVLAYQFRARLDFLDFKSGRQITVTGPRETAPSFQIESQSARFFWKEDNQHAYWSVAATDDLVFALFSGHRDTERKSPSRIHVFNWAGEFLGEVQLDRESIVIAASPNDNMLFGMVEEPWPAVAGWAIPLDLTAKWRGQRASGR
jgi:hypothetical protein